MLNQTRQSFDDAFTCLERVTEVEPNYADAWALLSELSTDAFALWELKDLESVIASVTLAERAIKLDPENQYAHYALAYAFLFFATRMLSSRRLKGRLQSTLIILRSWGPLEGLWPPQENGTWVIS